MSTWNYRLVDTGTPEVPCVALYEVYYDDDGRPVARTADPTTLVGDDDAEARRTVGRAVDALDSPTLLDSEIGSISNDTTGASQSDHPGKGKTHAS